MQQQPSVPQKGPYPFGARISVSSVTCIIDSYIAEGGGAHVYKVHSVDEPHIPLALKVAITANEDIVQALQKEAELMRLLSSQPVSPSSQFLLHCKSVSLSQRASGATEALFLLEYCPYSLIQILQQAATTRQPFSESQIWHWTSQIALAIAALHYHTPAIAHRDIKIENILLTADQKIKLCDYGSCTSTHWWQYSAREATQLSEEIERLTTPAYRAPEQCDTYMRKPLTEKVDIWALGILVYKLCYWITPFETGGTLAILNCQLTFPPFPNYSNHMKTFISTLLTADPIQRPDIYKVTCFVFERLNQPCPLTNIYPRDTEKVNITTQPAPSLALTPPMVRAIPAPPTTVVLEPSTITPMRRGRPPKSGTVMEPSNNKFDDPFASIVQDVSTTSPSATVLAPTGKDDDPFGFAPFTSQKETSFQANFSNNASNQSLPQTPLDTNLRSLMSDFPMAKVVPQRTVITFDAASRNQHFLQFITLQPLSSNLYPAHAARLLLFHAWLDPPSFTSWLSSILPRIYSDPSTDLLKLIRLMLFKHRLVMESKVRLEETMWQLWKQKTLTQRHPALTAVLSYGDFVQKKWSLMQLYKVEGTWSFPLSEGALLPFVKDTLEWIQSSEAVIQQILHLGDFLVTRWEWRALLLFQVIQDTVGAWQCLCHLLIDLKRQGLVGDAWMSLQMRAKKTWLYLVKQSRELEKVLQHWVRRNGTPFYRAPVFPDTWEAVLSVPPSSMPSTMNATIQYRLSRVGAISNAHSVQLTNDALLPADRESDVSDVDS